MSFTTIHLVHARYTTKMEKLQESVKLNNYLRKYKQCDDWKETYFLGPCPKVALQEVEGEKETAGKITPQSLSISSCRLKLVKYNTVQVFKVNP